MSFKQFKESFLKEEKDIYIIECNDSYLKNQIKNFVTSTLTEQYTPVSFSLNETTFQEVYNQFKSTSLFGEKFIINVSDCTGFERDIINLILKEKRFKNKIFFFFNTIKNKKLLQVSIENSCYFSVKKPEKKELIGIVKKFFKKNSIKTAAHVEEFLVENLPDDMESLNSELRKIVDFHNKSKILQIEDLKKIIFSLKEENIFTFIDNFLKKDFKNSIKTYYNLIQLKTDVEYILNLLINNTSNMLLIKSLLKEKNLSYNAIHEKIKINPYALKKQYRNSENFSFNELSQLIEKLILLQFKIRKFGKEREILFRNFLLTYLTNK